ncbi:MAG: hypothetical protein IPG10_06800 [Flavobacteriales bacterium]|nr:hypothetical protein [Flavobacteriales bacterium]MBK7085360.1 hypothetical protein [Flavobacteriales bacterium]MBK7268528.1 hypothetical protein [Flavobacteriales bacterium]MBK7753042.1 hypothetical protein [Flavobacteriales bacterium]MBK9076070.1 hypothetical protein [Flavobacteriales bacterium]
MRRTFFLMALFFIAMAFLESAVVVYLRALYYPQGFDFPLVPMDRTLVRTEVGREIATVIMLLIPGALVTPSRLERFAWFCFGFGIWDIFYYVWLKVLIDWPASFTTPDLLFLVPVPWVGPVWCPCIISLGLIALAVVILSAREARPSGRLPVLGWCLLCSGALLMIASFVLEPWRAIRGPAGSTILFDAERSLALLHGFRPEVFPLGLFLAGVGLSGAGLLWTSVRMR